MDCARVKKHLKKYLRHTSDAGLSQSVEEHLSVCSDCRNSLEKIMASEESKFSRKLIPVAAFCGIAAVVFLVQMKNASCGIKKDPASHGLIKLAQNTLPARPKPAPKNDLEAAFPGEWAALFIEAMPAGKSPNDIVGISSSFPQEEGDVPFEKNQYHYVKIAATMNADALIKTVTQFKETHKDKKIIIASRLESYLQSNPPATETSTIYFYLLTPANK